MKILYSIIYLTIGVVTVYFLSHIVKEKSKKSFFLKIQLGLFLCADSLYLISYFLQDGFLLSQIHCVLLIFEVWISFQVLCFGLEYAKTTDGIKRAVRALVSVMACLDSAMIIFHMVKGNLFHFVELEWLDSILIRVEPDSWYLIHLFLVLGIYLWNILLQFGRGFRVPKLFRGKFISLGTVLFLGLFACAVIRTAVDFEIFPAILYIAFVECTYFTIYYYVPRHRKIFMNNYVIDRTTTPILLFDTEDRLQVLNKSAVELLGVRPYMKLKEFAADSNLKYILTDQRRKEGKTKEFTMTTKIGDLSFLIHGQELYDERKRYIGMLLLYSDITNQEKLKDEATFHATRDNLTGMWNRDYFFENVEKTIQDNPDVDFVMIASDIHRFMMFNEILGKKTGDDLLVTIANGYEERCRENWVIGRISGDRFAMIMPKKDFDEVRFMDFTQWVFERRGYSLKVHVYVGVYEITDRSLSAQEMYDRTYMAIESIKGNMQQSVAYYDDSLRKQRLHEIITVDEMEKAIREHEFIVYLQPQVDSRTHKVVGSEALVRWMNKDKGMVAPVEFIPIFESNGMISRLDYYVWEEVCKILKRWKDEGHLDRTVSVNISAKDFYLTNLYANIVGLVEKYDINPRNMKLEITESAFALNADQQAELVRKFRNYGFIVEIDDFGSGYSSLNNLKDIEVDVLKLDMKFFQKCYDQKRSQKIIESMVSLAYNLNMLVIAEGVETEEQVTMLRQMGCDIVQGFFFARPMPVDDFEKYVEEYPCEDFSEIYRRMKQEGEIHRKGRIEN